MAIGNPFSRDREGTQRNVTAYKALTIFTFLLNLVFSIMYASNAPGDGAHARHGHLHHGPHNHRILDSNYEPTPFTPSYIFVSIYWITLFILQIGYIWHLFSENETYVRSAAAVGSHFILFNLLQFAWIMLWTRDWPILSELILIANFFQLLALYFRHSATPRWVHVPVVAMPLTWIEFAIFWNGAVMVHCRDFPCRIVANVFIWSFLFYALFFLLVFKDWTIGFCTAFLLAGLGVGQFPVKIFALQWIFAFTIMSIVFVFSLIIAIPGIFGRETGLEAGHEHHHTVGADRERAPLLADDNA